MQIVSSATSRIRPVAGQILYPRSQVGKRYSDRRSCIEIVDGRCELALTLNIACLALDIVQRDR